MAIKHELSSSYNPQSNGHAEQAVKTVKSLLKKTDTFDEFKVALTEWRNTPRFDGLSPAQWFLGYRQRTATPAASRAYNRVTDEKLAQHANRGGMRRKSKKKHHDRSAVELEQLKVGSQVVVQDPKTSAWSSKGVIIGKRDNGRSYHIELAGGGRQMRNRRQIRPCKVGHMNKNGGTDGHLPDGSANDQINSPKHRRSNRPKKKVSYAE